jgi:hypothetical protein
LVNSTSQQYGHWLIITHYQQVETNENGRVFPPSQAFVAFFFPLLFVVLVVRLLLQLVRERHSSD